jgi:hypothetical protein
MLSCLLTSRQVRALAAAEASSDAGGAPGWRAPSSSSSTARSTAQVAGGLVVHSLSARSATPRTPLMACLPAGHAAGAQRRSPQHRRRSKQAQPGERALDPP